MDLADLIAALSKPESYAGPVDAVEVHQTHISVAFLAGRLAFKIKKPVCLAFLDYSTLERRHHYCHEEVRINARLATTVYLGVVPVTSDNGVVRIEGTGEVVEWAVKMMRLPASATLAAALERRTLGDTILEDLAHRLAAFHSRAERGPAIARSGQFATVAGNARENFEESQDQVGITVSRGVFTRLQSLTEEALQRLRAVIAARAARGVPCDGHGDLRLDHVYLLAGDAVPAGIVVIDAIEFNERYRHADPVADIAFLVMDLLATGHRQLAALFGDAYLRAAGDDEGRDVLPFYTAYRAVVRAKVEALKAAEPEIAEAERVAAHATARARWLLALGVLEIPSRRPCLVLVGGLPGSGKSALARALAAAAGFMVIRSDVVRKELAASAPGPRPTGSDFEQGIYSPEWTDRTYKECLRRAEAELFEGRRVVIDASFGSEANRRRFLDGATRLGVPGILLVCQAPAATIEQRLKSRHGDPSDADWEIYQQAAARWEPPGPLTQPSVWTIETGEGSEAATAQALGALAASGLFAAE